MNHTSLERQAAGRCRLSGDGACVPWDRSTSLSPGTRKDLPDIAGFGFNPKSQFQSKPK